MEPWWRQGGLGIGCVHAGVHRVPRGAVQWSQGKYTHVWLEGWWRGDPEMVPPSLRHAGVGRPGGTLAWVDRYGPVWRTGTRFNATQPESKAQGGGSAVYIPIPPPIKI